MSRDSDNYTGLHREYATYTGSDLKLYGLNTATTEGDPSGGYALDVGEHECEGISPFFPFGHFFFNCRNEGSLEIVTELNVVDAMMSFFGTPAYTETIAERGMIDPPPDYVQIRLAWEFDTDGGNNTCLPPEEGGAGTVLGTCPTPVDGTLHFDVSGVADFPWDFGPYADQDQDLPLGEPPVDQILNYLRRTGGPEYTGMPTNEAVDELIPWGEFVASPTVTVAMSAEHVYRLRRYPSGVSVRLWYRNLVPGDVELLPGPGGWRRRKRIFGGPGPEITVG